MNTPAKSLRRARGVATVEFSLVCLIFITLIFAALEFARMLYVFNSLQEVTRRAAREMTVRWITDEAAARQLALFGAASLPGGAEVSSSSIVIDYLAADGSVVTVFPSDPGDNLSACGDAARTASCIYSVRVSIGNIAYTPMTSLFGMLGMTMNLTLPTSSVTMHAESMGFDN